MGVAIVPKKNFRRHGIDASKQRAEYIRSVFEGPTPERLAKAQGFFVVGDDQQGTKIHRMRDDTLERLEKRKILTGREYAALVKYRHHWTLAGKEITIGSIDLNRIFTSEPSRRQGMPMAEGQMFHRAQWLKAQECIGHRAGIVVDNVVCAGVNLEYAGGQVGWTSKPQAIAAATEMLRDAGCRLAKLWGIG